MIETDRLLIRLIGPDDAPFVLELFNTDLWIRFIGDRGIRTPAQARQYILDGPMTSYEQFGFGPYVVELKASAVPIGLCGLFKRSILDHPDIGFAFLPDYLQNGYGYESASAVMTYATGTLGLSRILGITDVANHNSIRLLEKLGLRFEKEIQFKTDGEASLLYGTPLT